MAPEVALSMKYGLPADIYSFAYVLWELTTLETPFQGFKREQHAKAILVNNVRPTVDYRCGSSRVQQLITVGWNRSPLPRPELVEILTVLKSETDRQLSPDYKATKTRSRSRLGRAVSLEIDVAA
jgi:serine/threonine protein kinase